MMRAFALVLLLSACAPVLGSNVGTPRPGSTQLYNDWVAFGGAFDFRKEPGVLEMLDPPVKPDAPNTRLTEVTFSQECKAAGGSPFRSSGIRVLKVRNPSEVQRTTGAPPFRGGGTHQMSCLWEGDQ